MKNKAIIYFLSAYIVFFLYFIFTVNSGEQNNDLKPYILDITATSNKNTLSKSNEVWLISLINKNNLQSIDLDKCNISGNWNKKEGIYFFNGTLPGSILCHLDAPATLNVVTHNYSGFLKIKDQTGEKLYDLFNKTGGTKKIEIKNNKAFIATQYILLFVLIAFNILLVIFFKVNMIHSIFSEYRLILYLLVVALTTILLVSIHHALTPGFYTPDSIDQLNQAIKGNFSDWHSPLMSWLWAKFISLTGNVSAYFTFNITLLWIGVFIWASYFYREGSTLLLLTVPLIIIIPMTTGLLGTIWKDITYAFIMLSLLGCFAHFSIGRISFIKFILLCFLALSAFLYRPNGIFSILCVIAPAAFLLNKNKWPTKISYISWAILTLLAATTSIISTSKFINETLISATKSYNYQTIQIADLIGIGRLTDQDLLPKYIKKTADYNPSKIMASYEYSKQIGSIDPLYFNKSSIIKLTNNSDNIKQLAIAWLYALTQHPLSYIQHRSYFFNKFLFSTFDNKLFNSWPEGIAQIKLKYGIDLRSMNEKGKNNLMQFNELADHDMVKMKLTWLILGLAILIINIIATAFKHRPVSLLLSLSGLFYMIPYFFITPACDYRYIYWSTIAFMIATITTLYDSADAIIIKICSTHKLQI